ncbi:MULTISPECIES: molecular chaperone [unclassified Serratia (in: enterobacteria)]|uniref:fimbrial biogenesis chaperone n=1 Tax=unclassified Serratia (in: enterobacteria) TaxID=2647522 RepID=UPI00068CEE10|nr:MULTISPECIES: hypothetical protein [unclassified Serratia (in: enterobacteria)]
MASRLISVARKALGLVLCALPWGAAQALIDISPKILVMEAEQATVTVINTGDTPEFVNVMLYQLTNPGVAPEEEQTVPQGLLKEPYLFATPFKLSLGPHQEKRVQLKALKTPEKERVYRLVVTPEKQASISGTQSNVMLLNLGFNGLVRQLPLNRVATWQHRCGAEGIELEATGTVRVEFSELRLAGKAVDDFNLYPGTPRRLAAKSLSGEVQDKPFSLQCGAGK